jgi:hypothetical protein
MKIEIISKDEIAGIEEKLDQLLAMFKNEQFKDDREVYNTLQVSQKLQVSTKTIQMWRNLKLIEFSKVNNKIYYTQKSVSEFLQKHSIKRSSRNQSF